MQPHSKKKKIYINQGWILNMLKKTKKIIKPIIIFFMLYLILINKYSCPVKKYLGFNCPSCGLTRALKNLLCLNLKKSFYHHPMLIFILPAIFFMFYNKNNWRHQKIINTYIYIICILFFILYIIRLHKNYFLE